MACKKAFRTKRRCSGSNGAETFGEFMSDQLIFGVNSDMRSDDVLQNNLSLFEWATRNKIYPSFWGRNLSGENALTHEEINFCTVKVAKLLRCIRRTRPKQRRIKAEQRVRMFAELLLCWISRRAQQFFLKFPMLKR